MAHGTSSVAEIRDDSPLRQEPAPHQEPEGIGALFHRTVEDGKAYAKAEVNYYKTVGTERGKALVTPLIMGVAALLFALGAFGALVATLFVALDEVMKQWLAGLLTVLILAAIAGVLGYLAANKAKAAIGGKS